MRFHCTSLQSTVWVRTWLKRDATSIMQSIRSLDPLLSKLDKPHLCFTTPIIVFWKGNQQFTMLNKQLRRKHFKRGCYALFKSRSPLETRLTANVRYVITRILTASCRTEHPQDSSWMYQVFEERIKMLIQVPVSVIIDIDITRVFPREHYCSTSSNSTEKPVSYCLEWTLHKADARSSNGKPQLFSRRKRFHAPPIH